MTINLKKALLAGTAIVAVGAFANTALAANLEPAGAVGAATALDPAADGLDVLINATASNATDYGVINVDADAGGGTVAETIANINLDNTAGLLLYDGTADADSSTLTVTSFADVLTGKTFTVYFGGTKVDGSGTDSAETTTLAIGTSLGDNGGTTLIRGGIVTFQGVDDESTGGAVTVAGNTLLTTLTLQGGAGAATETGAAVTGTFGDTSADTLDVTGFVTKGGAASATKNGGAATGTVHGAAAIGTGNLAVTGGAAANNAAGGAATLTFANDVTITGGTVTVTGGADANAAAADGGDAALTFSGDVTSNSTLALSTGAQAAGGGGLSGDATVTFGGDATFTAITMDDLGDGAVGLVINGTGGAQTIIGTIDGVGSADGTVTISNADGVTFNSIIGGGQAVAGIAVNTTGGSSAATFTKNTSATAITMGDGAGTGTNTVTFTSAGTLTVAGTLNGDGGGNDTNNVNIQGGGTVAQSGIWGGGAGGPDLIAISGNTIFDSNAAVTATKVTVASGSTIDVGAGLLTAPVVNTGTLLLSAGGGVTGAVTGTGLLDVNASATVTGAITQGTADIGAFTLTQGAASGYTVGTTNFSGAGTLALLGGTQNVTGNFTNTTAGQGTITVSNVAGTTTIVGNIGETDTTDEILAFNILGATAQTVTTTGNIYAATMAVNDADTLQFLGNSAQFDSADMTDGILTVGNGTTTSDVTFTGTLASLASATTSAGAISRFNGNATTTGTYTNTGTTYVAVGKVLTADVLTDTSSYVLKANDANLALATADFGSLTDSGANGTLTGATANRLFINVTGQLAAGTVRLLTGINTGAATLQDDSLQFGFAVANNGANTDVTVTRATIESLADGASTAGAGGALDGLVGSANTEIAAAIDNIAAATTTKEVHDLLASVSPDVSGGGVVAAQSFGSQVGSITSARVAMLRDGGDPQTGMAAGEMGQGSGWWVQAFGTKGTQDERDNVDGYDVDSMGVALGGDTQNLNENTTLGVALSYANTNVDSDNAGNDETDIDSYQLALYGNYDIDNRTYVAGQVGYIWGNNDTTRHNVGGIAGNTANGSFDSNQVQVRAEVGRDFMADQQTKLTPKVVADYTWYNADSYTETGAGGLNANVDQDNLSVFNIGAGVDAAWNIKHSDGSSCEPALHAVARYDLLGDNVQTTNSFTGGGNAFQTEGADPARLTGDLGADLTYHATTNWDLKAGYNFEVKQDFTSHSGLLKATYKF